MFLFMRKVNDKNEIQVQDLMINEFFILFLKCNEKRETEKPALFLDEITIQVYIIRRLESDSKG